MTMHNQDCETWREEYLFGMLDTAEEEAFLHHADTCETCRREVAEHKAITQLFAPPPMPFKPLNAREHEKLLHVSGAIAPNEMHEDTAAREAVTPKASIWTHIERLLFGDVQPGRGAWFWPVAAAACIALLMLPQMPKQQTQGHHKSAMSQRVHPTHKTKQTPRTKPRRTVQAKAKMIDKMQFQLQLDGFRPLEIRRDDTPKTVASTTKPEYHISFEEPDTSTFIVEKKPQKKANQNRLARATTQRPERELDFTMALHVQAAPDGTYALMYEHGEPILTVASLTRTATRIPMFAVAQKRILAVRFGL